ncbi:PilZ domain-containing protein [Tsuneonella sp. SYSU-LHT278]|uniref:PilZ domain-containing protein n=1 Tax=Tsuneonella sediminis TaxID=3416089 RepID=UPI003F791560
MSSIACAPGRSPVIDREHVSSGVEALIGRRQNCRHPIDLAARFVSSDLNIRLQLADISPTGASARLIHPRTLREGRLLWLDYACLVSVVWQAGLQCGFRFEERLETDQLRRTLEFGEAAAGTATVTLRKLASAWVHGPGDY